MFKPIKPDPADRYRADGGKAIAGHNAAGGYYCSGSPAWKVTLK